jgi:hypothetical protein
MSDVGPVVPLRFDLSDLVKRSVATLYSHLVTRPTGQALRVGIESQISELGARCLTVLDFSEVVVLDYSCAEETVAKLLQRFQRQDRPADAYFVARGVDDRHQDTLDAVLARQGLTMVAELVEGPELLGHATPVEAAVWSALQRMTRGDACAIAAEAGYPEATAASALDDLAHRRTIMRVDIPRTYFALTPLIRPDPQAPPAQSASTG